MYKLSPFSRRNKFSPYLFKSENSELIDLLQNKDSWYPNELEGDSIFLRLMNNLDKIINDSVNSINKQLPKKRIFLK